MPQQHAHYSVDLANSLPMAELDVKWANDLSTCPTGEGDSKQK